MSIARRPGLAFNTHFSLLLRATLLVSASAAICQAANQPAADPTPTLRQYCFGCHGKAAVAGLNLEKLTASNSIADHFQHWERVIMALEEKRMPPAKLPQPSDADRARIINWVRTSLNDYAKKHAGDPGRVTVRRLTSGEYTYTVQDLTGLDLKFDADFASDSVGGEGFANYGDVQFVDDANLERYLDAAKRISNHAVIGSGPLSFYEHPGKSGFELSAVTRIQNIYRSNGFRAVAGEGAKPYGLDRYGKAFYAAWRFHHRKALGEPTATLEQIASKEGITPRFIQHIWALLQQASPAYPISDVVARWQKLPAPTTEVSRVRAACEDIQKFVIDWPRWVFAAGPMESAVGDDRVFLLTDETLKAGTTASLRYLLRARNQKPARIYLTVANMNPNAKDKPVVRWKNGVVRPLRGREQQQRFEPPPSQPLKDSLGEAALKALNYGQSPDGGTIDDKTFAIAAGGAVAFDIPVPQGATGMILQFDVEIPAEANGDAVVRPTISDQEETTKGRTMSALLAYSTNPGYQAWKTGVLEFAAKMPQNSHGEPTPSDRDPIPAPFNNTYNQPERDRFHAKVKYFRTDKFLVDTILDDAARVKLDQAWNDLLGSADYHDQFLSFVSDKYKLTLSEKSVAKLPESEIAALPAEPRQYVKALRTEYDAIQKVLRSARPGHLDDTIRFAGKAWRRPLTKLEEQNLRALYTKLRSGMELEHTDAIRSVLTRVLIAPSFLYRLEQPSTKVATDKTLSDWEVANRLSYFLWSSMPDDELRRAASARELSNPQQIEKQVKRMLADGKSRRLATEFFGQWLGFYRFDQHRGVDITRYPEFTDEVKSGMYDEAISFFEHIVRKDRPIGEMLTADYTFLTAPLAKHYGVKKEVKSKDDPELVEGANAFNRGGLLRLGAVLTATSAPLRTSPVKRGDWLLRRILGTPTPPPPPDAGSIPADDKAFGGLTLFERLEQHKRNATCASCHTRIDPLGFPLERFDAVGRWRETYSDGKPVHDSATLADNTPIKGVDGLMTYLMSQEKQVLKTFSYKLLGYALGRTVLLSDHPLIDELTKDGSKTTFSKLVSQIVSSRQFRYRREQDEAAPGVPVRTEARPAGKGSDRQGGL